MWLFEFLLGMFIAYLILSPKLRHFIFRRHNINHSHSSESIKNQERQSSNNLHGKVEATKDDVVKWMTDNPELRKINGIKS